MPITKTYVCDECRVSVDQDVVNLPEGWSKIYCVITKKQGMENGKTKYIENILSRYFCATCAVKHEIVMLNAIVEVNHACSPQARAYSAGSSSGTGE